jgi:hypothetical protein
MKKSHLFLFFIIIPLITCCAPLSVTSDISIEFDYDQGADFVSYKTFSWMGVVLSLNDPEGRWQPRGYSLTDQAKKAIEMELTNRSITRVGSSPDLHVFYAIGVDFVPEATSPEDELKIELIKGLPRGTLGVFLLDARDGHRVWSAVASGNVIENPDRVIFTRRLKYALKEMFRKFPR